jgi:serine/threonine protein kinase
MVRRFDIWSFACVFAEMLDGKILFPGEIDMSQLLSIAELLGNPKKRLVRKAYLGQVRAV